jgi:hypothetical protein
MNDSSNNYEVLGAASGFTVFSEENTLIFVNTRTGTLYTFLYILFLFCLIPAALGTIFMYQTFTTDSAMLVPALALYAVLVGAIFLLTKVWKKLRVAHRKPMEELDVLCIIDLQKQAVYDRQNKLLTPLSEVEIKRHHRLTSSAKSLQLRWSGGNIELCKGNPFGGGTEMIEKILHANGLMK